MFFEFRSLTSIDYIRLMHRSVGIGLVIFLLCLATVNRAQSSAVIRGVVVDAAGVPISRAAVILYSPARVVEAKSDAAGEFELVHVPGGELEMEVSATAFQTKRIAPVQVGEKRISIGLEIADTGRCPTGDSITYSHDTPISGRTSTGVILNYGDDRRPLSQATIRLSKQTGIQTTISQRSNEKGEFHFGDLESGRYIIEVSHSSYHEHQTDGFWITRENRTAVVVRVIRHGQIVICE